VFFVVLKVVVVLLATEVVVVLLVDLDVCLIALNTVVREPSVSLTTAKLTKRRLPFVTFISIGFGVSIESPSQIFIDILNSRYTTYQTKPVFLAD
jgi:hypothetical protein